MKERMKMTTYIELHALQNIAPSNLNRDDNGAPKTAVYGGATRHRVSSQSWKKAIREHFNENYAQGNRGFRTKNVGQLIANQVADNLRDEDLHDEEKTLQHVVDAMKKLKIIGSSKATTEDITADALMLISQAQVEAIAEVIAEAIRNEIPADDKEYVKALKASLKGRNSLDLALFGRMVASNTDLNVEASCQFAHAISTHEVSTEFDFFTAVDDFSQVEHDGSAMMGDIGFTSSTLYRFASTNVTDLLENFHEDVDVVVDAIANFIVSFTKSMPSGMQNTFATHTLPEVMIVSIHSEQPYSYVGAFETPIRSDEGFALASTRKLVSYAEGIDEAYGTSAQRFAVALTEEQKEEIAKIADVGNLNETLEKIKTVLREILA